MLSKISSRMLIAAIVALATISFCTFATALSPGDVIGKVYSTDIVAYIDGNPINSYNIGGRTVVALEDLNSYGFDVKWNNERRLLSVLFKERPESVDISKIVRKTPGNVFGNVYFSDINVTLGGLYYYPKTYNIGGRTCVAIEDLGESGFLQNGEPAYSEYAMHCDWNADKREIYLYTLHKGDSISTPFGTGKIMGIFSTYYKDAYSTSESNAQNVFAIHTVATNNDGYEKPATFISPLDLRDCWGIEASNKTGAFEINVASPQVLSGFRYGTYGHPSRRWHLVLGLNIPAIVNGENIEGYETNFVMYLPSFSAEYAKAEGVQDNVYIDVNFIEKHAGISLEVHN